MSSVRRPLWGRILGAGVFAAALITVPVALAAGLHGPGGPGGPGFGPPPEPTSASDIRSHMEEGAQMLFDHLGTTDAQETKIEAVLDELAPKMWSMKAEHDAVRDEVREALTSPTVDRAKLEDARQKGLALADEASADVMDALADVADVLSVDQREDVAAFFDQMHH